MQHRTVDALMTKKVVSAGPEIPFKDIVKELAQNDITAVPVVDAADRVVGVVSEGDLTCKSADRTDPFGRIPVPSPEAWELARAEGTRAEELMSAPAACARPEWDVVEAAHLMAVLRPGARRAGGVPGGARGSVRGRQPAEEEEPPMKDIPTRDTPTNTPADETPHTVSDVMTRTVVAVSRAASFKEIAKTLAEWEVSALPVLEGEGRVIGVVSEADLLPKQEYKDRDPSRLEQARHLDELVKAGARTAEELMTSPAVTVHGSATLAEAARAMAHKHVKRLPVVDDEGKLAGIVSRSDLLKVYLRADEDIAEEVRREVIEPFFRYRKPTVEARVKDGVVTLAGTLHDTALVPVMARLIRAVEGVVNVELRLSNPVVRHRLPEPPAVGPQF